MAATLAEIELMLRCDDPVPFTCVVSTHGQRCQRNIVSFEGAQARLNTLPPNYPEVQMHEFIACVTCTTHCGSRNPCRERLAREWRAELSRRIRLRSGPAHANGTSSPSTPQRPGISRDTQSEPRMIAQGLSNVPASRPRARAVSTGRASVDDSRSAGMQQPFQNISGDLMDGEWPLNDPMEHFEDLPAPPGHFSFPSTDSPSLSPRSGGDLADEEQSDPESSSLEGSNDSSDESVDKIRFRRCTEHREKTRSIRHKVWSELSSPLKFKRGFVYAVRVLNSDPNMVKIGWTEDPLGRPKRLRHELRVELDVDNPYVSAAMPVEEARRLERIIHADLDYFRHYAYHEHNDRPVKNAEYFACDIHMAERVIELWYEIIKRHKRGSDLIADNALLGSITAIRKEHGHSDHDARIRLWRKHFKMPTIWPGQAVWRGFCFLALIAGYIDVKILTMPLFNVLIFGALFVLPNIWKDTEQILGGIWSW